MERFFGVVRDGAGNALASVTVQVNNPGTSTPSTIYSDNTGTVLANPFTNNVDGTYEFFAANGRYDIALTKTGFGFPASELTGVSLYDPSSTLTPTAITGNTNNYAPSNAYIAAYWRVSATAAFNITGIAAPPTASSIGYKLVISVVGSFNITFTHNDAASSAANRLINKSGANVTLTAGVGSIEYIYDATSLLWRQVA